MPKLDSTLPEEQPAQAAGSGLPEFCYSDEFTRNITRYISIRAWKWNVPGQLKSLAGRIEAAVPTMEDVIQEVYAETLEGAIKKRHVLAGKPEIEYMKYMFRIARNKLAGTMAALNGDDLTDLKAKVISDLKNDEPDWRPRNVGRLPDPIDSANDEGEALTVEGTVTGGRELPYDDLLSMEVLNFMAKEFEAMEGKYPHIGEFHELITGLHEACDAKQDNERVGARRGKNLLSFSNQKAAAYLNARYPDHEHDDSTYHRQWVKVMLPIYKEYGYRPVTKPRGLRKSTEGHEN